jgi:hypothetical protein
MREALRRSTVLGVAGLAVLAVVGSIAFAEAAVAGVRPTTGVARATTAAGVASVAITPASPARATTGSVVAYLATVTAVSGGGGNALSGTVSFTVNSKALTGCSFLSLNSDTAICTITFAAPGTYRIVASYGYDPNFAAAEATVTQVVVTAVTPFETVVAAPSPVAAGGKATLSVHLSGPHGTVSGKVEVVHGSTTLCAVSLRGGSATCAIPAARLGTGRQIVVVRYTGTGYYRSHDQDAVIEVS